MEMCTDRIWHDLQPYVRVPKGHTAFSHITHISPSQKRCFLATLRLCVAVLSDALYHSTHSTIWPSQFDCAHHWVNVCPFAQCLAPWTLLWPYESCVCLCACNWVHTLLFCAPYEFNSEFMCVLFEFMPFWVHAFSPSALMPIWVHVCAVLHKLFHLCPFHVHLSIPVHLCSYPSVHVHAHRPSAHVHVHSPSAHAHALTIVHHT